jgi:hypothetical protein
VLETLAFWLREVKSYASKRAYATLQDLHVLPGDVMYCDGTFLYNFVLLLTYFERHPVNRTERTRRRETVRVIVLKEEEYMVAKRAMSTRAQIF